MHRPNATRPTVDWDERKARPKRTNTSVVSADALWGLSAVACGLYAVIFEVGTQGRLFEGLHPESRAERSVKQLAFADHNPFAIG